MTTKSIMLSIALALGASLLLAVGGYFWLRPALTPALPQAVMPTVGRAAGIQAESDLYFTTMEQIRGVQGGAFQPRPVTRNPFIWPEDMARLQAAKAARDGVARFDQTDQTSFEEPELPQVKLIMIGDQYRLAMLGRQVVREGDKIMNHRVISIAAGEVVVTTPDRREIRLAMVKPPGFIAAREPGAPGKAAAAVAAPVAVPREDASDAEKMRYLMREMQQMQGIN